MVGLLLLDIMVGEALASVAGHNGYSCWNPEI